jgi:signal transduction histidine kinase
MRWWPRSLFGQLLVVLTSGMLVAQLLSAAINFAERDSLMQTASGMQQVQRITDVVQLLDSLGAPERERIVAVLSVPPLVLSLHDRALGAAQAAATGPRAMMFASMLRSALGDERAIHVEPVTLDASLGSPWPTRPGYARRRDMMGGPSDMMRGAPGMDYAGGHGGPMLRTEVQLRDGRWARFDAELPTAAATLPWRLALTLLLLLCAVLALSFLAVRWVTRPLHVLAAATEALGKDINRPPLPESGPLEIQQAARAFNTMQARLARLIEGRTRVLTAMSHDLKTPITRMRLRADLLDDDDLRERFEADLKEMESMVTHTLEFMRGLGGAEPRQELDVMALLESLQRDQEAMGRTVRIEGRTDQSFVAVASLLKRCLTNLIDNAVLYGGRATVMVEDTPQSLTLRVLDDGPGIPETELEKVFEPFYRLEGSRSRETGGTGLGLTIARNIAQTHGGNLVLRNRPEHGLEAVLTLPRKAGAA